MTRSRLAWVAAGLLLAALIAWAWLPERPHVETDVVVRGDVVVEVLEEGRTRVRERFAVAAPVTGSLRRIRRDPGDPVRAGDVVAEIDASRLDPRAQAEAEARLAAATDQVGRARARVAAAEITATRAAHDARRTEALVQAGALAARDLEVARAEVSVRQQELVETRLAVQVAEAERAAAQAGVAPPAHRVEVRAPADGVVLDVTRESGGPVVAGADLLSVGDLDALEVVADVASDDAVLLGSGAPARIERWGGEPLRAEVRTVEPTAETRISALGVEEQRVDVVLRIQAPPSAWARLGDGYGVEARIVVARRDDVLLVPESAVFRLAQVPTVFRLVGRRAERTPVTLGLRNGVVAEVLDGLALGDVVILHPSEEIRDGTRVRLR